jgi:hypothetical protein
MCLDREATYVLIVLMGMVNATSVNIIESVEKALELLAPEWHILSALGPWIKGHHRTQEWYYDFVHQVLYGHTEGSWATYRASNLGRLRFHAEATSCNAPGEVTRVTEVDIRARYIEVMHQYTIREAGVVHTQHFITYTTDIGDSIQVLLRHIH